MDMLTRKYISEVTQRIMEAYNIETPISDMEAIVQKFGGRIETKIDFDDVCDGTIQRTEDNSFVIAISEFQNRQRKLFTIAHELGHLFLHMGFITDDELWSSQKTVYRRFGTSEQEYQANEFAASFLMPEGEYKEKIDFYSNDSRVNITEVAKYFNVSIPAAINRGRFLGYLE